MRIQTKNGACNKEKPQINADGRRLRQLQLHRRLLAGSFFAAAAITASGAEPKTAILSPDGRNSIEVQVINGRPSFRVLRDDHLLFGPSPLGPKLNEGIQLDQGNRIVDVEYSEVNETFELPWGKTKQVIDRGSRAKIILATETSLRWQIELAAYDDGVAFRYCLLRQEGLKSFTLLDPDQANK